VLSYINNQKEAGVTRCQFQQIFNIDLSDWGGRDGIHAVGDLFVFWWRPATVTPAREDDEGNENDYENEQNEAEHGPEYCGKPFHTCCGRSVLKGSHNWANVQ